MNDIDRRKQVERSAVWAAYGDALGFITELADPERVLFRSGTKYIDATVPWKRKVSGRIGSQVLFPAGTYSDDTQLRLATSRAIRADGTFDVVAFSKIELPVWLNYALGAGLGTKEAASSLARTSATWFANFFDTKKASYSRGGGNGAAMRIQPHVWAARDLNDNHSILSDVVRNTICTHGHPTGIVGAAFHALALQFAMLNRRCPQLDELGSLVGQLEQLPTIIDEDNDLRLLWVGPWQDLHGQELTQLLSGPITELEAGIRLLKEIIQVDRVGSYSEAAEKLGAFDPKTRGSATGTTLLASYLACLFTPAEIEQALLVAANLLGSDTDSIGTMVGALLGCCTDELPKGQLQDKEYLISEAARLAAVSARDAASSYPYPDLRSWQPPRVATDAVVQAGDDLYLTGLGPLAPIDDEIYPEGTSHNLQWCELKFGQRILARIRHSPAEATANQLSRASTSLSRNKGRSSSKLQDLFGKNDQPVLAQNERRLSENYSLNTSLQRAIKAEFDPAVIGKILLEQVDNGDDHFVERGIAITATILTAYEARKRKHKG